MIKKTLNNLPVILITVVVVFIIKSLIISFFNLDIWNIKHFVLLGVIVSPIRPLAKTYFDKKYSQNNKSRIIATSVVLIDKIKLIYRHSSNWGYVDMLGDSVSSPIYIDHPFHSDLNYINNSYNLGYATKLAQALEYLKVNHNINYLNTTMLNEKQGEFLLQHMVRYDHYSLNSYYNINNVQPNSSIFVDDLRWNNVEINNILCDRLKQYDIIHKDRGFNYYDIDPNAL